MNRIEQAFAKAREENRAVFVAYLCAGDPDFESSIEACRAIIDSGVDILEIGVPFSDPLADGLLISSLHNVRSKLVAVRTVYSTLFALFAPLVRFLLFSTLIIILSMLKVATLMRKVLKLLLSLIHI